MQIRLLHILPLLAALFLSACMNDFDTPKVAKEGSFAIELAEDSLVEEVETRAARELNYGEASEYLVTLTHGAEVIWKEKQFKDITQADRIQPLGNNYVVMAEDVTKDEAESANNGWGCLRYAGQSDAFSIVANQTTHVTVPCRMANAGLRVYFDSSFTDFFTDYAVTTDDVRGLKFFSNNGDIAYYNPDATTHTHEVPVIISASAGWEGTVRLTRTINLQTGKIIRLKVKLNSPEPTEGNISLSITYDNTFDDAGGEEIFLE